MNDLRGKSDYTPLTLSVQYNGTKNYTGAPFSGGATLISNNLAINVQGGSSAFPVTQTWEIDPASSTLGNPRFGYIFSGSVRQVEWDVGSNNSIGSYNVDVIFTATDGITSLTETTSVGIFWEP